MDEPFGPAGLAHGPDEGGRITTSPKARLDHVCTIRKQVRGSHFNVVHRLMSDLRRKRRWRRDFLCAHRQTEGGGWGWGRQAGAAAHLSVLGGRGRRCSRRGTASSRVIVRQEVLILIAPAQKRRFQRRSTVEVVRIARGHGAAGHYAQPCDPVGWAGLSHRHRPCLLPQARGGWPSSMARVAEIIYHQEIASR